MYTYTMISHFFLCLCFSQFSLFPFLTDFTPKVIDLRVAPFNSSAIDVSWKRPTQENSCYLLVNYTVACRNTNKRRQGPPVMVPSNGTHSHSVMFTSLESDSGYNCTVAPIYTDLLGNVARIGLSSTAYDIGNTYPSVPRVNMNRIQVETDSNTESVIEGTAALDLREFVLLSVLRTLAMFTLLSSGWEACRTFLLSHRMKYTTLWATSLPTR